MELKDLTLDELLQDESLSYQEMAEIKGVSPSTIYKRAKEKGIVRKRGPKRINLDNRSAK